MESFEDEIGIAPWSLLKAHHARGALVLVSPDLNLPEVGRAVVADEKEKVQAWVETGLVTPFPHRLAHQEPSLRCMIAQPWVVCQELHDVEG